MWLLNSKKRNMRDKLRHEKLMEGHKILLDATLSTTEMCHDVKSEIKNNKLELEDIFEDGIIISKIDGNIIFNNIEDLQSSNIFNIFPNLKSSFRRNNDIVPKWWEHNIFIIEDNISVKSFNLETYDNTDIIVTVLTKDVKNIETLLIIDNDLLIAGSKITETIFGYENVLDNPMEVIQDYSIKNGSLKHINHFFLYNPISIMWKNRKANLIIIRDITKMKQAIDTFFSLDNGLTSFITFDQSFKIKYASKSSEKYFNNTPFDKTYTGKNILKLLSENEKDCLIVIFKSLTRKQPIRNSFIWDNVEKKLYEWIDQVILDDKGNVVEYQHVARQAKL